MSNLESTLVDTTKPIPKGDFHDYKFEPRWFKEGVHAINGDYCASEEWGDPRDREKHQRRIAVFDARTGEDVTTRLAQVLSDCAEFKKLNPVLTRES